MKKKFRSMTLGLRVGCPAVSEWKADGFKVRNFFFSFFYVQGEKLDLERFNSSRERSVYEVGGIRHEGLCHCRRRVLGRPLPNNICRETALSSYSVQVRVHDARSS